MGIGGGVVWVGCGAGGLQPANTTKNDNPIMRRIEICGRCCSVLSMFNQLLNAMRMETNDFQPNIIIISGLIYDGYARHGNILVIAWLRNPAHILCSIPPMLSVIGDVWITGRVQG